MQSFQHQHSHPPHNALISVESSIQNLMKNWLRRQRWHRLFLINSSTREQQEDSANRAPWRTHLANFLESPGLRVITMALLLLDIIITILELSSSLHRSCPRTKSRIETETWLHWLGIAILSLLSAKTMALAVGLGALFFRRPGYVLDGVGVVAALALEALLETDGGGLLLVVSLWRMVRVVESAFELSDEAIEAQIEGIVMQFEALREENRRLSRIVAQKDAVIKMLQEELNRYQHHESGLTSSSSVPT
ncbi:uncharacterized protein LOC131150477 [Malania oleifera]|uniref:uncharacterized protein LOC131150477 n=1 Tax=Malania oleifera TaxID=397392 RepID=UPI0025AE9B22|nr:uncharacterized protein LOC131150477 [Malania oleifera]